MVSKIESDSGCLNWHPEQTAMPGREVWFVDRNQDGPCEVYSVLCQVDDSFTRVSQVEDENFLNGLGRSDDAHYTTLAVLKPGDLPFITESYSPAIEKRVKVRVTHEITT